MACTYDLFNRLLVEKLFEPTTVTATTTSAACDLAGYEGATFVVEFGTDSSLSGSNYWTCKLTECATSSGSYTDVAAGDVIGNTSNQFGLVDSTSDDGALYSLGYKGNKRYIKVVVTEAGTCTGTPLSIIAVKGRIRHGPSGQGVNP